jgi:radical SAM superfamily enzyme YgiQ (UPF0313 family)
MIDLALVAINAKYIHTNLAVYTLKRHLESYNVQIIELSINDSIHRIFDSLLSLKTDLIGFSCYIWNFEIILKLAEMLKKARPEIKILLGGPEVSFDSKKLLVKYHFIDFIIQGEGERKLFILLEKLKANEVLFQVPGLCFRNEKGEIYVNSDVDPKALEDLAFPYVQRDLENMKHRIVYYETMRGCPYSCSYCLSSTKNGLTMLPMERVFTELDCFIDAGVKQVKLVDRTFNCNMSRAKEIFKYLIKRGGDTNFHFEITGNLIDEEMIYLLKNAPSGLIQFEIGVQTTNQLTLEDIGRKISLAEIEENIRKLIMPGNIHIHLDLIAGLPYDTYDLFKLSFNRVIDLSPDMLQLGFLKLLKGTRIRKEAYLHEYQYASFSPYEIISNKYISCNELYQLRHIEVLVDRYYNGNGFRRTMAFIFKLKLFRTPFDFFESFSFYWHEKGYYNIGISKDRLYPILQEFMESCHCDSLIKEWIKFDFLANGNTKGFTGMEDSAPEKEWIFEFLKNPLNLTDYLEDFLHLSPKKIFNHIRFQYFSKEFVQGLFETNVNQEQKIHLLMFTEKGHQLIN